MTEHPIAAILDQLAAHTEQIGHLDSREAGNFTLASQRINEIAAVTRALHDQVAALLAARAGRGPLNGEAGPGLRDGIAPPERWQSLAGAARGQAVARLRDWVEQVYLPGYGQLAATLGPCWDQHTLCLYALDILAGLWTALYLGAERTPAVLSAQAEFQARIVPALAEQMATETSRCRHARERLTAHVHSRPTRSTS